MSERKAYGTANSTAERAAQEQMSGGKAFTMWRAAAEMACWLHLEDLHQERDASRAHRLVEEHV